MPDRKINFRLAKLDELKPHPRNYRQHPEDQLEHIAASLKAHGCYRNVVVAKDNTILAGHGVVLGARKIGWTTIPVYSIDCDPDSPQALKILTGDNETGRLGEIDDRALSELLKQINDSDSLLGTGFDEAMLAALVLVSRPAGEIEDFNAAAEWVGMPDYDEGENARKLVVSFRSDEDRAKFVTKYKLQIGKKEKQTWMTWWPAKERNDLASVKFQ